MYGSTAKIANLWFQLGKIQSLEVVGGAGDRQLQKGTNVNYLI